MPPCLSPANTRCMILSRRVMVVQDLTKTKQQKPRTNPAPNMAAVQLMQIQMCIVFQQTSAARIVFSPHVNKRWETQRNEEHSLYAHTLWNGSWNLETECEKRERERGRARGWGVEGVGCNHGQEPYFNSYDVIKNLSSGGKVSLFLSIL